MTSTEWHQQSDIIRVKSTEWHQPSDINRGTSTLDSRLLTVYNNIEIRVDIDIEIYIEIDIHIDTSSLRFAQACFIK